MSHAASPLHHLRRARRPARWHHERGVGLLELLVGITVGLLVIAVATGAMMVSRGVSGTVSDASSIQQQGAYAMRLLGQQLRQAGALKLDLAIDPGTGAGNSLDVVQFHLQDEPKLGQDSSGNLRVVSASTTEPTFSGDAILTRDCIGAAPGGGLSYIESVFKLVGNELRCGSMTAVEPILRNVADFQTRFLVQDNSNSGLSAVQYTDASALGLGFTPSYAEKINWSRVIAVEACLVLYGAEAIDMPAGASYIGCDGNAVDMTALTGARARRLHIAQRSVFQLRPQGVAP